MHHGAKYITQRKFNLRRGIMALSLQSADVGSGKGHAHRLFAKIISVKLSIGSSSIKFVGLAIDSSANG